MAVGSAPVVEVIARPSGAVAPLEGGNVSCKDSDELGAAAASRSIAAKEHGNALLKEGKLEEARKAYATGILDATVARADASRSTVAESIRRERQRLLVTLHANRALASLRLGLYTDALSDCDRALSTDPKHGKAAYRRGEAFAGMQRFADAREAFTDLLRNSVEYESDGGSLADAASTALERLEAAEARVSRIQRGELEFPAMLAEASLPETLKLRHSVQHAEFVSDALLFVPPAPPPGDGRARCKAQRDVQAGELLVAAPPLVFATYHELSSGNHQILLDRAVEAARNDETVASCFQQLCGEPRADEAEIREVLRKGSSACATGVGLWPGVVFINHAPEANATRAHIADWVVIRAKRSIAAGDEVTLSFIDATAEYAPQASWLESIGVVDEQLERQAARWANVDDQPTHAVKAALAGCPAAMDELKPSSELLKLGPLAQQQRYLAMLGALDGEVWCWGQLVRWLRMEQAAARDSGELQRALGASLAAAELIERHSGECATVEVLQAWADCAAMLFDLPGEPHDEEQGAAMELCIDGVQRGIEFVFGAAYVEDADFSTVVLQWATSRWWHAAAWQKCAAQAAAVGSERVVKKSQDLPQAAQPQDALNPTELSGMD